MSSFYGYGVEGKYLDPKYSMKTDVIGFDAQTYAQYLGLWFTITFIPTLLLGGPLIENYHKTNVLGWCNLLSGMAALLHGFITHIWQAHILISVIGLLQGLSASLTY
jgi:hypothetical protein